LHQSVLSRFVACALLSPRSDWFVSLDAAGDGEAGGPSERPVRKVLSIVLESIDIE
jgi:hypothetical protein